MPHGLQSALVVGIDLAQCRQRAVTVHQVAVLDVGVVVWRWSLQHDNS